MEKLRIKRKVVRRTVIEKIKQIEQNIKDPRYEDSLEDDLAQLKRKEAELEELDNKIDEQLEGETLEKEYAETVEIMDLISECKGKLERHVKRMKNKSSDSTAGGSNRTQHPDNASSAGNSGLYNTGNATNSNTQHGDGNRNVGQTGRYVENMDSRNTTSQTNHGGFHMSGQSRMDNKVDGTNMIGNFDRNNIK